MRSSASSAKRYVVLKKKPGFQMVMELKNGCFLFASTEVKLE